ncbi:unnamed protein product [Brugia timori]|uniref:Ovule protein n=1 Tax=Brugia timori TaxID=42155 RepID=A0A0R3Q3U9_9BILA|nr:unnamed protein product [Brugia timori]
MSSGSLIMDKPSSAVSFIPIKTEMDLSSHGGQTDHLQVDICHQQPHQPYSSVTSSTSNGWDPTEHFGSLKVCSYEVYTSSNQKSSFFPNFVNVF